VDSLEFPRSRQFASRSYGALAGSAARGYRSPTSLLVHRITDSSRLYCGSIQATLGVPTILGMVVDNLFWVVVVFGLVAIGLVVASRRALPSGGVRLHLLRFLALWPHKLSRFLLPMIPFVLLLMTWGAAVLGQRWQRRRLPAVFALLGAFIVVGCLQQYLPNLKESLACPRENSLESPACFSEAQRSFFALARYVRENHAGLRQVPYDQGGDLRLLHRPSSHAPGSGHPQVWSRSATLGLRPGYRVHRSLPHYRDAACRSAFCPCAVASRP
jgi:hypothetical protein